MQEVEIDGEWCLNIVEDKPDKLFENVVMKLDFGIDLIHLKNSKFVMKEN